MCYCYYYCYCCFEYNDTLHMIMAITATLSLLYFFVYDYEHGLGSIAPLYLSITIYQQVCILTSKMAKCTISALYTHCPYYVMCRVMHECHMIRTNFHQPTKNYLPKFSHRFLVDLHWTVQKNDSPIFSTKNPSGFSFLKQSSQNPKLVKYIFLWDFVYSTARIARMQRCM